MRRRTDRARAAAYGRAMTWIPEAARWLLRAALFCIAAGVPAAEGQDAAALQARYAGLRA